MTTGIGATGGSALGIALDFTDDDGLGCLPVERE